MSTGICIGTRDLPPADLATFLDSSFFSRNGPDAQLPSPADVRQRCWIQDPRTKRRNFAFPPVYYEELGLIVKFGPPLQITAAEGQCLWALRRVVPEVPVPEVYGWTRDGGQNFIYMELVQGCTLAEQWDHLNPTARVDICNQLSAIIAKLRELRHSPGEFFLGHINGEPLGDTVFTNECRPPAGPFKSVAKLHDWMSWQIRAQARRHWPGKEVLEIPDPYRSGMPDNAEVVFTHGDLHRANIIVSKNAESPKVLAIIDWRQSGWYPDYWEFCKAMYTAGVEGEWMDVYIPMFVKEQSCLDTFEDYSRAFGY
ncbi:phosphotransferase enzyme family protein [Triangularia verruculosa]|uniref:Phosphotransferase enzyme family protein n=1 Tax=Triangularia verruculosa TaxID=2587418 RepID=A0AAN7ATV2_9PEZI|nr:phosphotransferase enzyme family protein [Triangularia verruculosa]